MDLEDIYQARDRIEPFLPITPLLKSFFLTHHTGKEVWLKLETQLPTGTFKPRPAFNSILTHLKEAKSRGVVTSSSGNFAQGAAYAAQQLDLNIIVVMTKSTSPFKIQRTKDLGAEVVICGDSHEERLQTTLQIQKETNRVLIHPYDSYETIAGDGTIGLELDEQIGKLLSPEFSVLVPVSGGGLIAGIAFTLKKLNHKVRIIGVQPDANSTLLESFSQKKRLTTQPQKSIADALTASTLGEKNFPLILEYVDEVISVNEEIIQKATRFFLEEHKLVVEPSGATPVAALLSNQVKSRKIICITSGGNINVISNNPK